MTRSPLAALALLSLALVGLVSCKSSPKKGLPKNLPKINVKSSAAPPKHNMNRGEYPFDERGNYVAAWAAEGSRGGGNIPAPQVETPVELPSPEPERPSRSQSRSSRMVVSSAPPPMPQPVIPPPPSRPAPTPTLRTTPPPTSRPSTSVASSSSSSPTRKPTTSSSTTKPKPKPKPTSSTLTHTVKSGDTLYALALRYKSSVAKIKSASGISSDKLKIGQKLRIPR
jgi:nucleoid-associated protein YgaU